MTAAAGASLLCGAVGGVTGAGEENEAVAQQRTPARLRGAPATATRNVEAAGPPGGPSSREYTNVTQVLEAYAALRGLRRDAASSPAQPQSASASRCPSPPLPPPPPRDPGDTCAGEPARHATPPGAPTVSW